MSGAEIWWKGPSWLGDPAKWPPEIVREPSPESRAERKVQKQLVAVGVKGRNEKFGLRKAMKIGAWILRFLRNCCPPSNKVRGPLTTAELAEHELFWIKRTQKGGMRNLSRIKSSSTYNKTNMVCWNAEVVYREIIPYTCQIQSFLQLRWFSITT